MAKFAENGFAAGADFIRFGRGKRVLFMLPGLGDGLKTVRGTAVPMAWMYRGFSEHFTVYALSRRRELPENYSTRQMAADVAAFLEEMGIEKADFLGVSMGGMIGQWLAVDFPEKVENLVLAVTCPCPNPLINGCIGEWVELAKRDDHVAFMDSNVRKMYSEGYYQKNKLGIPLVARMTKPRRHACSTMRWRSWERSGPGPWWWAVSRIFVWVGMPPGRWRRRFPEQSCTCMSSGVMDCMRRQRILIGL